MVSFSVSGTNIDLPLWQNSFPGGN